MSHEREREQFMPFRISHLIDPTAVIAQDAKIWQNVQIRENAVIGSGTTIGNGVYIGGGVNIGLNCKIQNGALIYEPAIIESGVFIGPGVIFTNDHNPRAISPEGNLKISHDWVPVGVTVRKGASVGAGAICVAPVTIGSWAMVAAGAVVTRDVSDFSLVVGNPARHIGWVGKAGRRLIGDSNNPGHLLCPHSGESYPLGTSGEPIIAESRA